MYGYGEGGLAGRSVEELMPPNVRARHIMHRIMLCKDARGSVPVILRPIGQRRDMRGIRTDGTLFPLEIGLSHAKDAAGNIFVVLSCSDLSVYEKNERERAEIAKGTTEVNAASKALSVLAEEMRGPLLCIMAVSACAA